MKLSRVLHVNSNRFYVIPFCCWNSQKVTTLLVFKLTLEPSEESRTHANVLHELPTWLTWIIFLCANLCIILRMPIFLTCRKVYTRTHTPAHNWAEYGNESSSVVAVVVVVAQAPVLQELKCKCHTQRAGKRAAEWEREIKRDREGCTQEDVSDMSGTLPNWLKSTLSAVASCSTHTRTHTRFFFVVVVIQIFFPTVNSCWLFQLLQHCQLIVSQSVVSQSVSQSFLSLTLTTSN